MANVVTSAFGGFTQNLTKVEQFLVAVLDVQAVVVSLTAGNAGAARVVSAAFAVVSTVVLVVKNFLANTSPTPTPTKVRR